MGPGHLLDGGSRFQARESRCGCVRGEASQGGVGGGGPGIEFWSPTKWAPSADRTAQGPAKWLAGDPLELGPGVGSVLPAASLAGAGLQKALAARPHGPQPPEPPWLSPDHNVTVPPLCSHCLAAVVLAWAPCPPAPWVLAPPAALHCLGANPPASLLPAPCLHQAVPGCPFSASLRSSEPSQLSGNSNCTFRPQGWGTSVTCPTLQQDSASPRPHTALGARAWPQG